MTTSATIQARTDEPHHPRPACPPWCRLPVGHLTRTASPGGWNQSHVAWRGSMTYRDSLVTVAEVAVEVSQFDAHEVGEDYVLEPVRLWVRGVDGDSSMTADEVAAFAGLIAQAASVVRRITGGAAGTV